MNENIDLTEILKDCPEGTEFYSKEFKRVFFDSISYSKKYPILVHWGDDKDRIIGYTKRGSLFTYAGAKCNLFPSKDQRDWSKFTASRKKKERFDPKTLQPFDKVLVKRYDDVWVANILSHYHNVVHPEHPNIPYLEFITISNGIYRHCIPYNDKTKYLVGTTNEAPEYYKYWED